MLNKWDYRYPYFGLQKLHMGYGYGYPIYPQISKHKDFMGLVNRLENRMANIEDNVSNISQDVVDELHDLLQQFNEIDTIISVDDVQLIVESAIDNIEYPEYITNDVVKNEITQAINEIDLGLSALEVQAMISDSIDELDVGLSESQVTVLIHESLAMIDTGLNYTQVQDLITLTLANLDVGMTEDDVADLIQFHIQAIPIDSIQSELASLRATIESLDVPDVDLSDVYSRLLLIESQIGNVDNYDDEWIHTEIQSLNELIQGIESDDVDLSGVLARLDVLESKVDNDTIYDDTELRNLVVQLREDLDNLDVGEGVDLSDINSRLEMLELKVDNDTIYDDTELRNLIVQLREDLDNLDVGEGVDLSEVNSRLEVLESQVDNDTIYDDEWIHTEIQSLNGLIDGIESVDSEYVDSEITKLREEIVGTRYILDGELSVTSPVPGFGEIRLEEVESSHIYVDEDSGLVEITLVGVPTEYAMKEHIYPLLLLDEYFNDFEYEVNTQNRATIEYNYEEDGIIYVDISIRTNALAEAGSEPFPPVEELHSIQFLYRGPDSLVNLSISNAGKVVNEVDIPLGELPGLEDRISELESRLDDLVISESQNIGGVGYYKYNHNTSSYPEKVPGELAIYVGVSEPTIDETSIGDLWIKTGGVSQPLNIRYIKQETEGTTRSGWFNFDSEIFSTRQPPVE